jgi:hypothetical protein
VQSDVDGVMAGIYGLDPYAALTVVRHVNVKDIGVSADKKVMSYTTDSVNLGNNAQWYFDNLNRPTSNLFFGSHL